MNNEDINKRVNEIFNSITDLQEELAEIRKICPHDSYHIGNWSWRPGAIQQARICNHCFSNIGQPSEEEYEAFLQEGGGHIEYKREDNNEDSPLS